MKCQRVSLIIAAGGAGRRFQKSSPGKKQFSKLFFNLGEKPILAHALDSFRGLSQIKEIVLAVPSGTQKWIQAKILKGYSGPPVRLIQGGLTRAESVWRALRRTSSKQPWVLVHDGARPFPPREAILRLFRNTSQTDGMILGRPVVPTLKKVSLTDGQILETVDRSHLFEAETPQLVRRDLLFKAYRENPKAFLATDESSLIESVGGKVGILSHDGWNTKVTTPQDLHLAEALAGKRHRVVSNVAVGFGRDTHRLVQGRKLYLGAVAIPFQKGTLGHSDGDALLHAIADAILGAAGLGDIGEWFPSSNPRLKNIRSEKIVKKIFGEVEKKGWKVERVDTVILLEEPKLRPYKKRIREKVAEILKIHPEAVSIKAKTQEGLGPEGEGLAVTCEALVLLGRSA